MKEQQKTFHQEDIIRIYRGQPALIEGEPIQEVLTENQYGAVTMIAAGYSRSEAAEKLDAKPNNLDDWIRRAYSNIGATTKDKLAGFLPLSPDDSLLEEKQLGDLSTRQLMAIEGLSVGYDRGQLAAQMGVARSVINSRINKAYVGAWPDCKGSVNIIRVANGLRASYVREYEDRSKSIEEYFGDFALDSLVSYEPRMREIFSL